MIRIALSCLLLLAAPALGVAGEIRLLGANPAGVTVEVAVPAYRLAPVEDAPSSPYTRIEIDSLSAGGGAGDPQLPGTGTLLAVPEGTVPVVVDVQTDTEVLSGPRIAPVPSVEVPADPLTGTPARTALVESPVYTTDALFPARVAEIGAVGDLRGQPVAQLRLNPVQTNPVTGETRVHTRIRVTVAFQGDGNGAAASAKPGARRRSRPVPPAFGGLMRRAVINPPRTGG